MAFMQKMWNPMSFPMPGMFMPTANVEDIEKKIAELKGVENWLQMNIGFLQMTVKTLEMQKSALSSFASAVKDDPPADAADDAPEDATDSAPEEPKKPRKHKRV
jgi:hypothetical protein